VSKTNRLQGDFRGDFCDTRCDRGPPDSFSVCHVCWRAKNAGAGHFWDDGRASLDSVHCRRSPVYLLPNRECLHFREHDVTSITVYLALHPIASVPCSLNAYLQSEALAVCFSPART
jgi:hypothetical protein